MLTPGSFRFITSRWCQLALLLTASACPGLAADQMGATVVPTSPLPLFNGKNLSSFYVWIPATGHSDPDGVFTVVDNVDGAPAIRISGQHNGSLLTREAFANYRLLAEWRWGLLTWGYRMGHARDSGIFVHCFGEDGNRNSRFTAPYLGGIEVQICEGATGDFLLLGGYVRGRKDPILPSVDAAVTAGSRIWTPGGVPTKFSSGRIDWEHRDPKWKDVFGFRGPRDVEKPAGEWNQMLVECRNGNVTYFLNGVKVNELTNGSLKGGKVLLESEGAEIYFRRVELLPLN